MSAAGIGCPRCRLEGARGFPCGAATRVRDDAGAGGFLSAVPPAGALRADLRLAAAAFSGFLRHTIRSLPNCCTGTHASALQICSSKLARSARSSLNTRILISSCAVNATSTSWSTAGVRPCAPMATTGWR